MKKIIFKFFLLLSIFNFQINSELKINKTITSAIVASLIGVLSANYYFGKKKLDSFNEKINNLKKLKDQSNFKEIEKESNAELKSQKENKWFGVFNRYFFHNNEFNSLNSELNKIKKEEEIEKQINNSEQNKKKKQNLFIEQNQIYSNNQIIEKKQVENMAHEKFKIEFEKIKDSKDLNIIINFKD